VQQHVIKVHETADTKHQQIHVLQVLTVNSPRTPAAFVMLRAACTTLGYTPACTLRMHTAMGTLTTPLPTAAAPPETNAI
jgi:hypothetical protein